MNSTLASLVFGNESDIVHWQPSPETRGTFDILSTCIITLFLCVWTAVHINVSEPGAFWIPFFRRVSWLVLSLLAPEFVVYTAWWQRRKARKLAKIVNKALGLDCPSFSQKLRQRFIIWFSHAFEHSKRPDVQLTLEAQEAVHSQDKHYWTIKHGFFALMGGLAVEIPGDLPPERQFLPNNEGEQWFVSAKAVKYLVRYFDGLRELPNLSLEEINSRSRANWFAKILVCVQAVWFIAQCITRLAQKIPISLLELNTFGHAICALLIYYLWWEKPFEVESPLSFCSPTLERFRAIQYMLTVRSPLCRRVNHDVCYRLRDCMSNKELESTPWFMRYVSPPIRIHIPSLGERIFRSDKLKILTFPSCEANFILPSKTHQSKFEPESATQTYNSSQEGSISQSWPVQLSPGQELQGSNSHLRLNEKPQTPWSTRQQGKEFIFASSQWNVPIHSIEVTQCDFNRWKMASDVFANMDETTRKRRMTWSLVTRVRNTPSFDMTIASGLKVVLGFSVAAAVYGGLHILAWDAYFLSPKERLLWRISACLVAGWLPIFITATVLTRSVDSATDAIIQKLNGPSRMAKILHEFLRLIGAIIAIILVLHLGGLLLGYILARAYLVVECFISLFNLPSGVYNLPNWSNCFPHIS